MSSHQQGGLVVPKTPVSPSTLTPAQTAGMLPSPPFNPFLTSGNMTKAPVSTSTPPTTSYKVSVPKGALSSSRSPSPKLNRRTSEEQLLANHRGRLSTNGHTLNPASDPCMSHCHLALTP